MYKIVIFFMLHKDNYTIKKCIEIILYICKISNYIQYYIVYLFVIETCI